MRMPRSFSCSASASDCARSAGPYGRIASAAKTTLEASIWTSLGVKFLLYNRARLYNLYHAYLHDKDGH